MKWISWTGSSPIAKREIHIWVGLLSNHNCSRYYVDLNRLQYSWLRGWGDIRNSNHKVPRPHHAVSLQKSHRLQKVTLQVFSERKLERSDAPFQVHAPHDIGWFSKSEDGAIWTISWKQGCHVASACIHKYGIRSQFVGCTNTAGQCPDTNPVQNKTKRYLIMTTTRNLENTHMQDCSERTHYKL